MPAQENNYSGIDRMSDIMIGPEVISPPSVGSAVA